MSDTSSTRTIETPSSGLWSHLLATDRSTVLLLLRITLAIVFFPHGAQKMLGWFGGPGFSGEMELLTGMVGLPTLVAFLVIVIEFFAPLALAAGLLSRLAALGIAAVMIGAVFAGGHLQVGFFMDWFGTQGGEGFEYHLLAIGIAVALVIGGGGTLSVDRWFSRDSREPTSTR